MIPDLSEVWEIQIVFIVLRGKALVRCVAIVRVAILTAGGEQATVALAGVAIATWDIRASALREAA